MHETGMQVAEPPVSLEKDHLKRRAAGLDGQPLLYVATWKGADSLNYMVITLATVWLYGPADTSTINLTHHTPSFLPVKSMGLMKSNSYFTLL